MFVPLHRLVTHRTVRDRGGTAKGPGRHNTFELLITCMYGDLEVGKISCDLINSCFDKRYLQMFEEKKSAITITRSGRISKPPTKTSL